jgi:hypothetical protein
VLQQPALVNAFQNSAGAMSSDPGDRVFLQELRKNFARILVLITKLRDAIACCTLSTEGRAEEITLRGFPIAH